MQQLFRVRNLTDNQIHLCIDAPLQKYKSPKLTLLEIDDFISTEEKLKNARLKGNNEINPDGSIDFIRDPYWFL